MWTKQNLNDLVREKLSDYLFVVVSNREPYIHTFSGRKIVTQVPASGLTTALDPVMQACGGFGGRGNTPPSKEQVHRSLVLWSRGNCLRDKATTD